MDEVIKPEEVVEENVGEGAEPEAKVDDRPEENWKAELDRKNREIERLRMEVSTKDSAPKQRDPNDISTWSEQELKAIVSSNDPTVLPFKEKAHDILLDRKVDARFAREVETTKRVSADLELMNKFPDALNPATPLAAKMVELTAKYDLSKTPAGRLVAAKLAAAELGQGKNASVAKGQKAEQDRVTRVKGQLVDGDRPKPTDNKDVNLEQKRKELADKLMDSKHEDAQVDAVSQILKDKGFTRDRFFGKK